MQPVHLSPCRVAAVLLVCGAVSGVCRAELLKVSPFLPPQGAAANAPTANAPLEYRGSMQFADVEQYRIVDPARKVGTWLKIGERDANLDVLVKQHDATHDTVTLEHNGQTLTLQLKSPKVTSAGNAGQVLAAAPQPLPTNVSPAVIQTVVPNPTPADEQRRLEAVAAEVARRRALREQAAQQAQLQAAQGGAPGGPPGATRHELQQAQQLQRR